MARTKKAATPATPPDARPINARGAEWEAEKLTGNRAQRGSLPGGAPIWVMTLYRKQKECLTIKQYWYTIVGAGNNR